MTANNRSLWYFENVNLYNILCPHKMREYYHTHPLKKYNKADFLFLPNDLSKNIYLVAKGKVKIGYYDDQGKEVIKAILTKGELLGEMALLGQKYRRDFAQAIENNTCVCAMSQFEAENLLRQNANFSLALYKIVGWRIKKLERHIEILLYKDTRTRLIEFLKDLAEERGQHTPTGIVIHHEYTQANIATLIGASRKTVSLLLNELETEDLIQQSRKKILIPNLHKLQ